MSYVEEREGREEDKRKADNRFSGLDEEESKCTRRYRVGRDGTEQRWMETDEATTNRLRHEYATTQEGEDVEEEPWLPIQSPNKGRKKKAKG